MRIIHLDPTATDPADVARAVRFRPDGKALAATFGPLGAASDVFWWDLAADRVAERVEVETDDDGYEYAEDREEYPDPAVSPDLELLAWTAADDAGEYEFVRLIDVWAKPRQEAWPSGPGARATYRCLAFDPAGQTVYAGGLDLADPVPAVFRWDVEALFDLDDPDADPSHARRTSLVIPDPAAVPACLAVSADGRALAVGADNGRVFQFDLSRPGGAPRAVTPAEWASSPVRGLCWSPDASTLVSWTEHAMTAWDLRSARPLAELAAGPRPTDAAFSPDGRTLAVSGLDGLVRFLDAGAYAERRRFAWGVGGLYGVAFAPDGLTCAAGGETGRVVLWDLDE